MAGYPRLPIHVGDYLKDTPPISRVSWEHHGIYVLLLMVCWNTPGCRLPNDPAWLSMRMGCSVDDFKKHIEPVLKTYFKSNGNFYKQKRLTVEYDYIKKSADQRSIAAKSRWNKGKPDAGASAAAKRETVSRNAPRPRPRPIEEEEPKGSRDLLGNLSAPSSPDLARVAVDMWNKLADVHGLAKVQILTDKRYKAATARVKEVGGLLGWAEALDRVATTPFLLGENKTGWRADFDFMLQPKSFTKLMEGSYSAGKGPARDRQQSPAMAELRRMANDNQH